MTDKRKSVRYRILGGSKHGQFIEVPDDMRTIKFPVHVPRGLNDDVSIPYRVEEYERSRFAFTAAGMTVTVMVPVGSSNAVIESYFVKLVLEG